ncbi:PAS domain S-box protein [Haloarcula marismortui]|uniref:histidine kinase n=1 Tax=Haloarcula marismortui ATCC 33800 TaxID=662476 RepID=M0JII5_9EURY|nr:PAS domain S-box protein [Haloarcula sinaiiensis]EMA08932.1 light and oxygen sensing histidine kinase [Haloarcula sinaiiensis ATCC 33800]QUJ74100.1 PAS domain S-box protein [Haloarcula sinaiiensis ATCC 33800]
MSTDNIAQETTPETVFGRIDEAVFALDTDWQFTYINQQTAALVDRDPATLLGESLWEVFPDSADSAAFDACHNAVETQEPCHFEMVFGPRDTRFVVHAYPSNDGLTVCLRELTAERERKLELQRSQQLFESVFHETEDAIIVADTDRRITDFNPAAERLFGYDASEVIGEKSQLLYADPETFERQGDKRFNEQAPQRRDRYVVEYERADGTTFEGETVGTPLKREADETFAFFATVRDVTSQLNYKRSIEQRNRALKQFHDITTDEKKPFATQAAAVLKLAVDYLDVETGVIAEIDGQTRIPRHVFTAGETATATERRPLDTTFDERVATTGKPFGFHDVKEAEFTEHRAAESGEIAAYLGVSVTVDDKQYGVLSFSDRDSRASAFSESEETFVRIVAQWAGKEISRRRNQKRANAERERLRQIIDTIPQQVFVKDADGTYTLANKAAAAAHGVAVERLEGATHDEFALSDEQRDFKSDDAAVIENGESVHIEEDGLVEADGSPHTVQTDIVPIEIASGERRALVVATDITEQKQLEAQLEQSKRRLRQIIDMLPQLVFAKDESGTFLLANEAVADAYGTTVDELEGATDAEFADSEAEAEQFRADDRAVIDSGEPKHISEESLTTTDGIERILSTRKIPYDPVDTPGDAVLGVSTDITELKQREAELEMQSAAMEASMDGISVLDDDREYIYMNEAHAAVFGYDPDDLIGSSWRRLYSDEEVERIRQEVFPELEEHGQWRGETVGRQRDGSPVTQELALSLLDDGKLICTNRDITEQKARENVLEQYEALIENMNEAAFIVDDEWRLAYANERTLSLGDVEPRSVLGQDIMELFDGLVTDKADYKTFNDTLERTLDGEQVNERCEVPLQLPTGEYILECLFSPFTSAGEQRAAVVARDVTAQKAREQELERKRARLRALFDESPDGIIVHDENGEIIDTNTTQIDQLGYEELCGVNVAEFEVGHSRTELRALWSDMALGETRRVEGNHRRKNGSIFPVEVWVSKTEVHGEIRFIAISRDISDRKAREREMVRNREFLEKTQNIASVGGWEIDLQTDELRWTDEVYRIHDLPLDADVTVEDGIDYYHPEERPTLNAVFDRLVEEGEPYDEELRIVTAADAVKWVRTVGDPEFDDGEVVGARGIFQDITDRKEREQDVQELTERLDLAVEGANLGVWDWDMTTDAVTFNEQWASMLGLSLDEIAHTLETWEERVHPADMDRVEDALEAHIAGEAELYDCDHRMRTASGEWKWIRDVGEVVERDSDGQPTRAVGIHLDITDQKRSENALEEERDMFAQGPAVVFKWQNEPDWPVEYVSENVTETFGFTPEELESGDIPYKTLIHDEDMDTVTAEVQANTDTETERFSHDPYRMVTADGEVKWVTDNTKIIRSDGEITHYLGYLIDITDRKRLEQSLRQSEQSLREMTEVASDTDRGFEGKLAAILELGCERLNLPYGFLTRIDDATQHIVEASGSHSELQAGASAPMSKAYCRRTIEQDEPLTIQNAVEEDWPDDVAYEMFGLGCYVGGKVTVNGELYGTLCFADRDNRDHQFDESERAFVELLVQWVRYELAGEAVETKLRELNETAQRLLSASDASEVASTAIESAKRVLGLPMTGIWWYDEGKDALVPAGLTDEAGALLGTQPTFDGEGSLAWETFESGEVRVYDDLQEVEARFNDDTPIRSETLVPLGDKGILISGSTEQRAFSETDRGLFEILAATVETALSRAEREQVLRDTRERLEQSNEELEQFAYAASHDLQEPLRTVSSYLTLLERRNEEVLDDDALEFIDFAVDGAERMREMIQALLAYSRVDTRGQAFESTDMDAVFDTVARNLEVNIEESGAVVNVPDAGGHVVGDTNQLVQLFQNLVENGIKYSEETPHVDISVVRSDDDTVEYAVSDDGIGMEPSQLDDIFEVFQRLHTREEISGTGIGLSMCRKIVDRHSGQIRVKSAPDEGSTFFVTLPAAGDEHE